MKKKNFYKMIVTTVLLVSIVLMGTGCGEKASGTSGGAGDTGETEASPINVVSREDGSGTRGAFIELFGIEEKQDDGSKVDRTIDTAEITNNTSVMMSTVAGDPNAIGYISLGSLNDTVKALKIDGISPSVDTINDGSYTISRPFNIATKANVSPEAEDFINFIMSKEGQDVIEEKGYIRVDDTGAFAGGKVSGKIVVAGSSSVTPVMEALKEAYIALNPDLQIEVQQSDSTTGMNSAIEDICDIGMASRDIKDSELEKGLQGTVIAMDGIAVIVSNENNIDQLTKEQVADIYTGGVSEWSAIQ